MLKAAHCANKVGDNKKYHKYYQEAIGNVENHCRLSRYYRDLITKEKQKIRATNVKD